MKYPTRIYYTETDKGLMLDRWQKGESLNSIARLFGRSHSSIQGVLARTGGIRPPSRRRSRRSLSLVEREEISRGVVTGASIRSIASVLDRAPSTVSREISRNGGRGPVRNFVFVSHTMHMRRSRDGEQGTEDRSHRRRPGQSASARHRRYSNAICRNRVITRSRSACRSGARQRCVPAATISRRPLR